MIYITVSNWYRPQCRTCPTVLVILRLLSETSECTVNRHCQLKHNAGQGKMRSADMLQM